MEKHISSAVAICLSATCLSAVENSLKYRVGRFLPRQTIRASSQWSERRLAQFNDVRVDIEAPDFPISV